MNIVENADEILQIEDRDEKIITVKAWKNKKLRIKTISAGKMVQLETKCSDKKGNIDTKAWMLGLVIAGVIKEDGSKVFNESHIKALSGKSFAAMTFIANEVSALNKLDVGTEEIAKN